MHVLKRSSRRPLGVLTALPIAFVLALAGCGGGANASVTTIVVQQQAEWGSMMPVLVSAFEKKYPDIKVKTEIVSSNTTVDTQMIAGNNPPDVAFAPENSTIYTASMSAHKLVPLTDVWKREDLDKRYGPETAASLKAPDGQPYVVSIDNVLYDIVYYNKADFAKAGIIVPADHRIPDDAALYAMVKKLRAAGLQPLSIDGKDPAMYGWMVDQLLQTAATPAQISDYLTNFNPGVKITANFTDPPFAAAVRQVGAWAANHVFQDGYQAQDAPTSEALFLTGKAGMYLGGSWSPADITKAGIGFGWMLLPPVPGGAQSKIPSDQAESMAIPTGSKHIAAAKKFLEFWMTDAMQEQAVAGTGAALPGVNTVNAASIPGLDPVTRQILADINDNGAPTGWTSAAPGAFAQNTIGTNLQQMTTGGMTVRQVLTAQQQALLSVRSS